MGRAAAALGFLLLASFVPPGAEAVTSFDWACTAFGTRVNLTFAQLREADVGGFALRSDGEGCAAQQTLALDGRVHAQAVEGVLALTTALVPATGGVPVPDASPPGTSVSFRLDFALDWTAPCDDPRGGVWGTVNGIPLEARLEGDLVRAACEATGPHTHGAPGLAVALLDALADALADAAPEAAAAAGTASSLVADALPERIEVAGASAETPRPRASAARPSEGVHVAAHAEGEAGVDGVRAAAASEARAPLVALDADAPPAPREEAPPAPSAGRAPLSPAPRPVAGAAEPAPAADAAPAATPERRAGPRERLVIDKPAPGAPAQAPSRGPEAALHAVSPPRADPQGADPGPAGVAAGPAAVLASVAASALVAAAFSLYQRIARPAALEHPLRAAIHAACVRRARAATPGELAREVGVGRKTAEYHLAYLARLGLVRMTRGADFVARYHAAAAPGEPAPDTLAEALAALVAARPGITTREAADALVLTRPRAERRLRDLLLAGRVEASLAEGERRFFPAPATRAG